MFTRWIVCSIAACLLTLGCSENQTMPQTTKARPAEAPTATAEAAPKTLPDRSEIDERYKWDLTDIFENAVAFEAAFADVNAQIDEIRRKQGTLADGAEGLLATLRLRDSLFANLDNLIAYAGLSYHEDMSNNAAQGRFDRCTTLGTQAGEAASWFEPELLALPEETVRGWMDANEELAVYRHYFDNVYRQRAHVLSPREESLLAMAAEVTSTAENVFSRFTNTNLDFPVVKDEKGEPVQLSPGVYYTLIYSKDRSVRRDAFLGMHRTYLDKVNTLSALLSAQVKQHLFYARARQFDSALEAALHGPGVPPDVYTNLIETISRHTPKLHRYVALRKKLLNLDEVHRYDLYVPMVEAPQEDISYDDAVETILTALQPLGDDYIGTLHRAFDARWIDVYETKNKRSGAYCWGSYLSHPYLLLNYHGTMNDRSTVAHEMGHAMHSWYTVENQPIIYGDYATFCAEVASTVNEVLLAEHLLNNAGSDLEKMLILQQQIEGIRTTVFRQTMFAEYEKLIHELAEAGQPLTGDLLLGEYAKLVKKYYGPEMVLDEGAAAEGLRIPHFYRNFYVYTYATSHCAATNIGRRIIRGEPGAVEALMAFLSAGSSDYPLDVLKLAGVDMTNPQPIEDTMALFDELLDRFEALYALRAQVTSTK